MHIININIIYIININIIYIIYIISSSATAAQRTRSRHLNLPKYKSNPSTTMGNAVSSSVSWSITLDHEVAGQGPGQSK
jgi:hypothetical protein